MSTCKQCGVCCKNLSIQDKISISWTTRSFMFRTKCRFQLKNNKCGIYHKRAKVCRKWESCYAFSEEMAE